MWLGIALVVVAIIHAVSIFVTLTLLWENVRTDVYHWAEDVALWVRTQRYHDIERDRKREKFYLDLMSQVTGIKPHENGAPPDKKKPENP